MNKKWKNYGLWVSIFSLIGLILQTYGLFGALGLTNESFNDIVKGVLVIMVDAGIISNPDAGNWFKDKPEDKQ